MDQGKKSRLNAFSRLNVMEKILWIEVAGVFPSSLDYTVVNVEFNYSRSCEC